MKNLANLFYLIVFVSGNIFAQQKTFQDALLDKMTGEWILQGTIAGQETTHDVSVSWVLGHQYIQIHEISHEKDSSRYPIYEAIVFIGWDSQVKQYTCLWLDVTGSSGLSAQAIANAGRKGDEIPFIFKGSNGSLFHTTFKYNRDSDTWQWLMDSEENGKIQQFAQVKLIRK